MQAGYGVWYGEGHAHNYAAHVSAHERQQVSVSRGELRGVLHAMLARASDEQLVVVLDSDYVFKGITQWSDKWRRHGWRTSSGEVGHRDLWEQILWLPGEAGDLLQVRWMPSHLGVKGNEGADVLAERGRGLHPNNLLPLSKRPGVEELEQFGLEPMPKVCVSETQSDVDSRGSALVTAVRWTTDRAGTVRNSSAQM